MEDVNGDFEEDEVFYSFQQKLCLDSMNQNLSSSSSSRKSSTTAPKMIKTNRRRKSSEEEVKTSVVHHHHHQQSSAPVNVPDWSKIYGQNGKSIIGSSSHHDHCDDEDDEGEVVPPHEWLAKKNQRTQMSSFSVCEGIGRTLKGRDLKRVRNAILTKTGFLE